MAYATKTDALFAQIADIMQEILLEEAEGKSNLGLDPDEALLLVELHSKVCDLWETYIDRLVSETVDAKMEALRKEASTPEDAGRVDRVRERIRARLLEHGIGAGSVKKNLLN